MATGHLASCPDCRIRQYELFIADGFTPGEAVDLVMSLTEDQP